jgi:alcohol dehydrogenase class IV
LTGKLHLHHGLANGLILPHVLSFNLPEIEPERLQTLKELLGLKPAAADSALVETITAFVSGLGLPVRLGELDVALNETERQAVAEDTTRMVLINNNPRPASAVDCRDLLAAMA